MAAIAALIVRYVDLNSNRLVAFVRLCYGPAMCLYFYRTTARLFFLIADGYFDHQIVAFEATLFGINPTLFIDRHLLNVWLNELFSLGYFSYYFMILVPAVTLVIRRDYLILKHLVFATILVFFISYLIFDLYPVAGPRWELAGQYENIIDGVLFRPIVVYVIDNGGLKGGAMPSSHFAAALAIMMYCVRFYRRAARLVVPLTIALAIGTVWGRFHYVTDVIVGGLIALPAVLWSWKLYNHEVAASTGHAAVKES
jgi:membrane-associated phospholipid phosphatase